MKVCQDRIWGLGRQGYKCLECKVMVHKRCHKFISLQCSEIQQQQHQQQQQQLNSFLSSSSSVSNKALEATTISVSSSLNNDVEKKHKQALRLPHQSNQLLPQTAQNPSPLLLHPPQGHKTSSPLIEAKSANKKSFTKQLNPFKSSSNSSSAVATPPPQLSTSSQSTNNSSNHSCHSNEPTHGNELEVSDIKESEAINGENLKNNSNNTIPSKQATNAEASVNTVASSTKQIGLDQFNLIKVIGRGSYAKVFLVEYKKTRKCYAMKVIKKSIVDDDEDIDWVQTEKHVFEQATNHPFLVGLHSCFQTESRLFFVIEYLCGGDLMYHMQRKRRLPEDHARLD